MPTFKYKAKKGPEEFIEGYVDAAHQQMAVKKVMELGAIPIDVTPAINSRDNQETINTSRPAFTLFKKIRRNDIVLFTRQISDLSDAAVPILRSLQIVSRQTKNLVLKEQVNDMYLTVKDGGSFSSALAKHRNTFSILYINMVRTGEVGGNLDKVLSRLADYLEKESESYSKIKSSLTYPAFILVVGILTVFVLLSFVIPRLSIMFDDLGQALPLPTIILMNVSSFFAQFWWLMVGIIVGGGIVLKRWSNTSHGRKKFDAFKLKMVFLI